MRDLWLELDQLQDSIIRCLHQARGWERIHSLVVQRGQLMNVLVDMIKRGHLPAPTPDQVTRLQCAQKEISSAIEQELRLLKQSIGASEAYLASKG